MEEISQDPRDCVYAAFLGKDCGTFDPQKLTIIREASLQCGSYTAQFAIIGESHFVRILDSEGCVIFAELLACVDLAQLGYRATHITFKFQESFTFVELDCAELPMFIQSGVRLVNGRTDHLSVNGDLPSPSQSSGFSQICFAFPGKQAPRTIVNVRVAELELGDCITISTVHEYAGKGNVECLETLTMIKIRRPAEEGDKHA